MEMEMGSLFRDDQDCVEYFLKNLRMEERRGQDKEEESVQRKEFRESND